MINQKRLKELLKYNKRTGVFTWRNCKRGTLKGSVAGGLHKKGYIVIRLDYQLYLAHRLAWLYVYGKWPKKQIDHKDRVKHHNWISNLRDVTNSVNHRNKHLQSNNKSGCAGVHYNKDAEKWQAGIKVDGVLIYLGLFPKKKDAITIRKAANKKYGFQDNDRGKVK